MPHSWTCNANALRSSCKVEWMNEWINERMRQSSKRLLFDGMCSLAYGFFCWICPCAWGRVVHGLRAVCVLSVWSSLLLFISLQRSSCSFRFHLKPDLKERKKKERTLKQIKKKKETKNESPETRLFSFSFCLFFLVSSWNIPFVCLFFFCEVFYLFGVWNSCSDVNSTADWHFIKNEQKHVCTVESMK